MSRPTVTGTIGFEREVSGPMRPKVAASDVALYLLNGEVLLFKL